MTELLPEAKIKNIPLPAIEIFKLFSKAGYEIYMVGAGSRNLLLGKPAIDCDFTTNAHPEVIQSLLPDSFYDNVFGTVGTVIKTKNGEEVYEITTYRGERGYSDFRRPDKIWWGTSIEEDLKRREFTIGAIAVGPTDQTMKQFQVIDRFKGQEDLKAKIVRAIGEPQERFFEDALRMMRAIRFASQLGFTIDSPTFAAIQKNAALLNQISRERVKDELFKILKSDFPAEGMTLLLSSGLLEYIIPEMLKGYELKQARHHIYDVWTHSVMALRHCPSKDPLIRLATLLHDVGKPVVAKGEGEERTFYNHEVVGAAIAKRIAQRLKFSKKEEEKLITLVRWHQFSVDERQTDSAIRRFIRNVGPDNIEEMLALRTGDRLGGGARETSWRLEKYKKRIKEVQKQPFSVTDLKIDGHDVMKALNLPSGRKVGEILKQIFDEVVEKKTKNQKEALLKRLQKVKNS